MMLCIQGKPVSCHNCRLAKGPVLELVSALLRCCVGSTNRATTCSLEDRAGQLKVGMQASLSCCLGGLTFFTISLILPLDSVKGRLVSSTDGVQRGMGQAKAGRGKCVPDSCALMCSCEGPFCTAQICMGH